MERTERFGLARETWIILFICLVDMLLTVWLLQTQRATEGNPLMAFYLDNGVWAMIGAKIVLVAMPIFVAEWARRHRPQFVHRALRFAIAVYVGLYLIAFMNAGICANSGHRSEPQAADIEQRLP